MFFFVIVEEPAAEKLRRTAALSYVSPQQQLAHVIKANLGFGVSVSTVEDLVASLEKEGIRVDKYELRVTFKSGKEDLKDPT